MDVQKMLSELYGERRQIDEAILVLQTMAAGQGRRRGRPPKWMSATSIDTGAPARRVVSAAARAKMAAAQKKRWAAKKKAT
jgi:hypothetical protein